MKWIKNNPQVGDIRIRKVFLFFPRCIKIDGRQRACYWLQFVNLTERYEDVVRWSGDYINEMFDTIQKNEIFK